MAGYESRDGKIAGNRQLVESHDQAHGQKSKHMPLEKVGNRGGGAGEEGGGGHDIGAVVSAHGPAHTHTITKNRGGGGHHSETRHEDGHVHHADHESLAEAHQHGEQAMGGIEDSDSAMTSSMLPIDESEAANQRNAERSSGFMK